MPDTSLVTLPEKQVEIAKALEEDIIFGRLLPGTRLVEDTLMERFDATRHVVRQALQDLVKLGVVIRERNKGAAVRKVTAVEVHQIYQVREMLHRQAALLIPLPASKELVERLESLHREYCRHLENGYVWGVHETNDLFHLELFGGSGNPYLVQSIKEYMGLSLLIRANGLPQETPAHHELILKLLRGTDSWALAQLCVEHLQPSKCAYLRELQELDEKGSSVGMPGGGGSSL